jgi:hypothetical protein
MHWFRPATHWRIAVHFDQPAHEVRALPARLPRARCAASAVARLVHSLHAPIEAGDTLLLVAQSGDG